MLCKRCPHLVRHGQLAEDGKNIEFKNICGLIVRSKRGLDELTKEGGGATMAKNGMRKGAKKGPEKAKKQKDEDDSLACSHYPFPKVFDYIECQTYQNHFKSSSRKNDVIPTKDFQYSDILSSGSITDMELL
jgi:hypothetical protein